MSPPRYNLNIQPNAAEITFPKNAVSAIPCRHKTLSSNGLGCGSTKATMQVQILLGSFNKIECF